MGACSSRVHAERCGPARPARWQSLEYHPGGARHRLPRGRRVAPCWVEFLRSSFPSFYKLKFLHSDGLAIERHIDRPFANLRTLRDKRPGHRNHIVDCGCTEFSVRHSKRMRNCLVHDAIRLHQRNLLGVRPAGDIFPIHAYTEVTKCSETETRGGGATLFAPVANHDGQRGWVDSIPTRDLVHALGAPRE